MKQLWKRIISLILVLTLCVTTPTAEIFLLQAKAAAEAARAALLPAAPNTAYDEVSGQVTVSGWPEQAAKLVLAGYLNGQMVFSRTEEDLSPSSAVLYAPTEEDFDTLKVFCLGQDGAPVTEAAALELTTAEHDIFGMAFDADTMQITTHLIATEACVLQVTVINEALQTIFTAQQQIAESESAQDIAVAATSLPDYFTLSAQLFDLSGEPVDDPYLCMRYTRLYQAFISKSTADFAPERVINVDDSTEDNFLVAADTAAVVRLSGTQHIEVDEDTGICRIFAAELPAVEEAGQYVIVSGSELQVVNAAKVVRREGYIELTPEDDQMEFTDFFTYIQLDLTAAGAQEAAPMTADAEARARSLSRSISTSLTLDTTIPTTASVSADVTMKLVVEQDEALDYFNFECITTTTGTIAVTVQAGEDLFDDTTVDSREQEIKCGKLRFPFGYGLTATAEVTIPVKLTLCGQLAFSVDFSTTETLSYNTNRPEEERWEKTVEKDVAPSIEGAVSLVFHLGLKLELAISMLQSAASPEQYLLKAGGTIAARFIIAAETAAALDNTGVHHKCGMCIAGDVRSSVSLDLTISYRLNNVLKGDLLTVSPLNVTVPLFDFYISLVNSGESPFGGQRTFGRGSCPNRTYDMKFVARDTQNTAHVLSVFVGAKKTISQEPESQQWTISTGDTLELYNGTYLTLFVKDGVEYRRNIEVSGKSGTVDLLSYTLTGHFRNSETNAAVQGVDVYVKRGETFQKLGSSDKRGNVSVSFPIDLGSNVVTVRAQVGSHILLTLDHTLDEWCTGTFDLGSVPVVPSLTRKAIVGALVDDTLLHRPVADAAISWYLVKGDSVTTAGTGKAGSDGSFSLPYTEAGTYMVIFDRDGYETVTLRDIHAAGGLTELEAVEMPWQGATMTISGKALDRDTGEGIPATVELTQGGSLLCSVTCGADGTFALQKLPAGTYSISIHHPRYMSENGSGTYTTVLTLRDADCAMEPVRFVKREPTALTVTSASLGDVLATAAANGGIELYNNTATANWTVTGAADISKSGDWFTIAVTSNADGSQNLRISVAGGTLTENRGSITFTGEDDTTHVVSLLQRAHTISGTVTDGTSPISGASVVVWNNSGFRADAVTTGSDGRYSVPVYDADYFVTASASGYEEKTLAASVSLADAVLDLALGREPNVVGTVVDENGEALEGVTIDVNGSVVATSDSSGQFAFAANASSYSDWNAIHLSKDGYPAWCSKLAVQDGAVTNLGQLSLMSEAYWQDTYGINMTAWGRCGHSMQWAIYAPVSQSSQYRKTLWIHGSGGMWSNCDNVWGYNSSYGGRFDIDVYEIVLEDYNGSITSLHSASFSNMHLTTFHIPASVTSLGETRWRCPFEHCRYLEAIEVDSGNPVYSSVDGVLFSKDGTTLLRYPPEKKEDGSSSLLLHYVIPDGVQKVGTRAFYDSIGLNGGVVQYQTGDGTPVFIYTGLQSLTFPASVTDINWSDFEEDTKYIPDLYFLGTPPIASANVSGGTQYAGSRIHFLRDQTASPGTHYSGWTTPTWKLSVYSHPIFATVCEDPAANVTGTVTDTDGTALAGVTINAYAADGRQMIYGATSDAEGAFTLQFLEEGSYRIEFLLDGYEATVLAEQTIRTTTITLGTVTMTTGTSIVASGTTLGGTGTWELDTGGVLTVRGTGTADDYAWRTQKGNVRSIVIESGITAVSIDNAGYDLVDGVLCDNYSQLLTISIPDTVVSLELTTQLSNFTKLLAVTVDENNPAYSSLDGVLYNKDRTRLICYPGGKADTSFVIPDTVTTIGAYAFCFNFDSAAHDSLRSVTLPQGLLAMEQYAFKGLQFTSLTLPESLTTIGDYALENTGLAALMIPKNVTSIGAHAFDSSNSLRAITVDAANTSYCSVDGVLFDRDMTRLICYPRKKEASVYAIPATVTTVDGLDNDYLTELRVGAGVQELGLISDWYCPKLKSITVDAANATFSSLNGVLYSREQTVLLLYPQQKADEEFTVPSTVTELGAYAFYSVNDLRTLNLPESLETLQGRAIRYCDELSAIRFYGDVPDTWSKNAVSFYDSGVLYYASGRSGWTSPTWTAPDGTEYSTVSFTP